MRPHRLVARAFGPFAGEVSVDFDPLAQAGLFLIHGETGAGKTSLLDAMSYALYGSVPGARTVDDLRSDHVPAAGAETAVTFEFSLRGDRWRIERAPAQPRTKKRGTGLTMQKPRVHLWRQQEGDWIPVAGGVEEVGLAVKDLLGLTAEQFQQVVILPQGEFQRVIRADPKERERLLSSLFRTGRFSAAAALLADRARQAAEEAARHSDRHQARQQAALALWDEVAALVIPGAPPGPPESVAVVAVDGDADAGATTAGVDVAALAAAAAEAARGASAARRGAAAASQAAAAAWQAGVALAGRHERRARAEAALVRADEVAESVAADGVRLDAAERAEPVLAIRHAVRQESERHERAASRAGDARQAALTLVAALPADLVALGRGPTEPDDPAGAERDSRPARPGTDQPRGRRPGSGAEPEGSARPDAGPRAGERPRAEGAWELAAPVPEDPPELGGQDLPPLPLVRAARERVAALAGLAAEAAVAANEAAALRTRAEAATAAADSMDTAVAGLEAERDRLHARLAAGAVAAAALPGLRARADGLAGQVQAAADLLAAEEALLDLVRRANQAHDQYGVSAQAVEILLEKRIADMAGELAAALRAGAACAVCGSAEHPRPAPPPDTPVTPAALATAREEADYARDAARRLDLQIQAARAHRERLAVAAGPAATDPGTAALVAAAAGSEAATAAAAVSAAERAGDEGRRIEVRITEQRRQAQAGRAQGQTLSGQADQLARRAAAAREAVVHALGPSADPQRVLASLTRLVASLERVAAAEAEAAAAGQGVLATTAQLDALLAERGFGSAAEAEAAQLPGPTRDRLRARVARWDADRAAATAALADPELQDLPPAPDVDLLGRTATSARDAAEVAVAIDARIEAAHNALAALAAEHTEAAAALGPQLDRAARLRRLAEVCAGPGNDKRMSLERYVLAAHMEEITAVASGRFHAMSDGRYTMRHSDMRVRGGGASGLSIIVQDAWTGVERDVGGLSGGETFQASLAFALAVVDVVQRHAGGVHLDALFVDEGFGSLDAAALDQALGELDRLRDGGRMVGIISHVPALREQIRARVEVVKATAGSTIQTHPTAA